MDQDRTERWKALCKQAETEKDPAKLLALVQEIDRLLEAEDDWLKKRRTQGSKWEADGESKTDRTDGNA